MASDWPKFADMNWLRLLEGPADRAEMDIAPTMKRLVVHGGKYFRMKDSRGSKTDDAPEGRTEYGGAYLWDGYWPQKLAEAAVERVAEAAGPEPG
jgi:hypothetical protein